MISWNSKLYFLATDSIHGGELWSYDGSSAPAKMVYDLSPGSYGGAQHAPNCIAPFNGKLLFNGGNFLSTGFELAAYDGINPPSVIANLSPGKQSSNPAWLTHFQGVLFFAADSFDLSFNNLGRELYRYDGVSFPRRIKIGNNTKTGSTPRELTLFSGKSGALLYFAGAPAAQASGQFSTNYLYQCDLAGNYTLAKGTAGISRPYGLTIAGALMYFAAWTPAYGTELYSYDGDTAIRLTDVAPGPLSGLLTDSVYTSETSRKPVAYHNAVYFTGSADGAAYHFYRYNTATQSVTQAAVIDNTSGSFPDQYYVYNDKLYFVAYTPGAGRELWCWNDTAASMVADIYPGAKGAFGGNYPNASRSSSLVRANYAEYKGQLYFAADDSAHGSELWRMGIKESSGVITQIGWNGGVRIYPNPADNAATLELSLPEAQQLTFSISDAAGHEVYRIERRSFPTGKSISDIPLQRLVSGQYFYRLSGQTGISVAAGTLVKD